MLGCCCPTSCHPVGSKFGSNIGSKFSMHRCPPQRRTCAAVSVRLLESQMSRECPLYPKGGHVQCSSRCPLWANSGHSVVHSMTSSARNNSDAGTDTPKTSALRKFRTNSNLVGRSIGRSAGLAPRSTFPERTPARLYSPRRFGP